MTYRGAIVLELGEKIRRARLEAGLSQRQLCDGLITRNMLSLIENGSANPSMDTLQHLAERLGKSAGYFLEDGESVLSPNQKIMADARKLYGSGKAEQALSVLESYRSPDPVFDQEQQLLLFLCELSLARSAAERDQIPYALDLLNRAGTRNSIYLTPALNRERILLLAEVRKDCVSAVSALPADDRELLIRAQAALEQGDCTRAAACLDAAVNHDSPEWNCLRGSVYFEQEDWQHAADCYLLAEEKYPKSTVPRLEICYRELEDYKMAYFYACKQRT